MSNKKDFKFVITIDNDDEKMNNEKILSRLKKYKNLEYYVSESKNTKISACNADMDKQDFDIVMLISDDQIPVVDGFDDIIRDKMKEFYQDLDGCLWFNDGYTKNKLNTLCIIGKKYYDRFGYIYSPEYKSFFCDDEYTEVAKKLNRISYFDQAIIKHEHPANNSKIKSDSVYDKSNKDWNTDKKKYKDRKAINFDIRKQNKFKTWNIMICSLHSRSMFLRILINKLRKQINEANLSSEIGITVNVDDGTKTIGEKRAELIENTNSKYCNFIDDDDDIPNNYIIKHWEGIQKDVDCISLNGIMSTNNKKTGEFFHNLKYKKYSQDGDKYYRPPNHLNVIKTKYVKKYSFNKNMDFSEDTDFAMRLAKGGDLKTQYEINDIMYHYIFTPKILQKKKNNRKPESNDKNINGQKITRNIKTTLRAPRVPRLSAPEFSKR